MAQAAEYSIADNAEPALSSILDAARQRPGFGNGRYVRNLFEHAVGRHAVRLSGADGAPGHAELTTITVDDLVAAAELVR